MHLQPAQTRDGGGAVVVPARLLQVEERHRGHRVLVHAVDRVTLDDRAGPHVVVPPPLTCGALPVDDHRGAPVRRVQRAPIARGPPVPGERLDGIDLVGEACDVGAEPAEGLPGQSMREQPARLLGGQQPLGALLGQARHVGEVRRREQCRRRPRVADRVLHPRGAHRARQAIDQRGRCRATHLGRRPGREGHGAEVRVPGDPGGHAVHQIVRRDAREERALLCVVEVGGAQPDDGGVALVHPLLAEFPRPHRIGPDGLGELPHVRSVHLRQRPQGGLEEAAQQLRVVSGDDVGPRERRARRHGVRAHVPVSFVVVRAVTCLQRERTWSLRGRPVCRVTRTTHGAPRTRRSKRRTDGSSSASGR